MDPGLTTTGGPQEEAIYTQTGAVKGRKVTQGWIKRHVLSRSRNWDKHFGLLHKPTFSFDKSDDGRASYRPRRSAHSGISPRLCT